eukprot:TRINITY_DN848_c0_g1_i1.p1 TRINITY_DN848_c0_g1~~TRINITY_DN848_c0_g1_i1.p1  ORF type:complete len:234 (+),score=84.68 TRINITY_DN848_c0_g1_i1:101-703(+)
MPPKTAAKPKAGVKAAASQPKTATKAAAKPKAVGKAGAKTPAKATKVVKPKGRKVADKKNLKDKALKTAAAIKKGTRTKTSRKVRTTVHFYRPKTLRLARKPKYQRRSAPRVTKLDKFGILKYPLSTESAMKKIETNSTLVFIVDPRANKRQIRNAIEKLYDIKTEKINTLIRPDGQKKAFARLTQDYEALDVASKIGII